METTSQNKQQHIILNIDNVCSIRKFLKCKDKYYSYKQYNRGFLGLFNTLGGYYFSFMETHYCGMDVTNRYHENGIVYHDPHIEIKMADGQTITRYFNNTEQLNIFIDHFFKCKPFIHILE